MTKSKIDLRNLGLLLDTRPEELKAKDFLFGAGKVFGGVINEARDHTAFLPPFESQVQNGKDSQHCVVFSGLNCIETLMKEIYDMQENYSEAFSGWANGCSDAGSMPYMLWEGVRKYGIVRQKVWDVPMLSVKGADGRFYDPKPTAEVMTDAKNWLTQFLVNYEYVSNKADVLYDALGYAPIHVSVNWNALKKTQDGELYYAQNPNAPYYHQVLLFKGVYGRYWEIYDHYAQDKKKVDWNYKFGWPIKATLSKLITEKYDWEFVKEKGKMPVYLRLSNRVLPINTVALYKKLSGRNDFAFRLILPEEISKYKVGPLIP